MAATEYFASSGTRPPPEPQTSGLYPSPPQVQRANSSQPTFSSYQPPPPGSHPSPQFNGTPTSSPYIPPPPAYQPLNAEPKVHFAQTSQPPTLGGHRPSLSGQPTYVLNQPNFHAAQGAQSLSPYPPGPYVPRAYLQQQQPQPAYTHSQQRSHSDYRSSLSEDSRQGGYSSDPEHQRRKHHKDRPRRVSDNSRSTNTDGLIGAAGGGLIGDLIFPGLGTVGGALVGWLGGKDYGKHRKWREDKRDREQERWEKKYHKGSDGGADRDHDRGGSRSRSHSRDSRDGRDDRDKEWSSGRHSHDGSRAYDGSHHLHSHTQRRKSYD